MNSNERIIKKRRKKNEPVMKESCKWGLVVKFEEDYYEKQCSFSLHY